jgi:alanine racemase
MRINLEQGINACQLVYDTCPNHLQGLAQTLQFINWHAFTHQKTLILTDIDIKYGLNPEQLYSEVAALIHTYPIDRLIGVGPQLIKYAHQFLTPKKHFYTDVSTLVCGGLLEQLYQNIFIIKNDANNHTVKMLIQKLRHQCHETVLEINLDAIRHNLDFLRSNLSSKTSIIAMVKAAAYGSSSFEIAHFLQQWGVDYLGVAYVDEGVTLRKSGIKLPIMVMNPSPNYFDRLLAHQLEPVIYSIPVLKAWKQFIHHQPCPVHIHIKLDTGMHRLGFMEHEVAEMIRIIQDMPQVKVKSVLSHLSAPGNQRQDAYTHAQASLFKQLATYMENQLGTRLLKHLLNTAGQLYHPAYEFDMVRLGIGLHGFSKNVQQHLQIASTLKTTISQIKEVPEGATIGYERKGIATKPTKIAVLAIGYADGFRRVLSNGRGKVWINGQLAPVIGNVCMDMTMVDITGIAAQEGDEVIIFGKEHPTTEVALAAGTIVYEVLTNVSERIKRVYYKEVPNS